ncbi:MAG TPA: hypothetical protein VN862_06995 [Candidatus Acidoferrales bacterium]|nr:hypothetical protein [Candidatus Acidoferrales bacterium]
MPDTIEQRIASLAHIIDSMYNQHAKWLDKSKIELTWPRSLL